MFPYQISVIIPVFNAAKYIEPCLQSLMAQTMAKKDFEVLLVDDGSTDQSGEICKKYESMSPIFRYLPKENGGVSSARNYGIEKAQGKYFLYLDSDDTLTPDTLQAVSDFFDAHYDEVDLVTYRIVPVQNGQRMPMHFRYKRLNHTGVFDLTFPENWFITQTTMNICVKNMGAGQNILFDTNLTVHEDQKYIIETLSKKKTIGFCQGPEYLYLKHASSAMNSRAGAYYIFEKSTSLWESIFEKYGEHIPPFVQAYYIHDLNWKNSADILLPYHYHDEDFQKATGRLISLIKKMDSEVILAHPTVDLYHKMFLLKLKQDHNIYVEFENDNIRMMAGDEEIYSTKHPTLVVNKFKVVDKSVFFDGFIKSPVFLYTEQQPCVYLIYNGKKEKLSLTESSFNFYHARIKTANFWRIQLNLDIDQVNSFALQIEVNGYFYQPEYYFMPAAGFHQGKKNKQFYYKKKRFYLDEENTFRIEKSNFFIKQASSIKNVLSYLKEDVKIPIYRGMTTIRPKTETWIYLDRYGVFDNAYIQFKHDCGIKDGVKRYYILNDCDWNQLSERFSKDEIPFVVRFRSFKHKYLYLNCDKIITSFSNLSNICPFGIKPLRWYSDLTRYELVYLQHGILHASLPNMYAKERCIIDRVVVSSNFEIKNFTKKYGYSLSDLIQSGMPRYDLISTEQKKKNRILFSPSWRSNLIGPLVENQREAIPDIFVTSDFYQEVSAFLNSPDLIHLLEENDLYLDFKNHPIFSCYNELFEIKSDRITVSCGDTKMDDYLLMITDYSSIVFDAVYLNCPILYFVPDYDKFKAGVSHNYRELDLPLHEGFGPFTETATDLLANLKEYVENDFVPKEPYYSRMKQFFLHKDNHCCDRLYQDLIKKR
ncbi:MAG: glycosyltransferase [Oscillospiraceae bacterium]|nr:glycosyltransferase [Oscillospiraceae bacterium]